MEINTNRQTVNKIYDACGNGDINTVLEQFTDDGTWTYVMPDGSVPFAGTFKGKQQIGEWFRLFGSQVQTTNFQINRLLVDGDDLVVVLGHEDGTIEETGNLYNTDWLHLFYLKDGKVIKFVEYVDVPLVLKSFGIS